jgi:cation diffusion facilitator family transporter
MIADAVHSLSDLVTDFIILLFVKISGKPQDQKHDFGHGKFETLAALIIGSILLFVGGWIAWEGISRILFVINGGTLDSPGIIALVAALISIVSKEILYRYTVKVGKEIKSDMTIANAWHHRSDGLSSIAVAIGIGGALLLGEKWTILDPIAALVLSFFIIWVALRLMKPSLDELMERSLPEKVEQEIISIVNTFEQVGDLHNLRTRKIGTTYAIEFHIRIDGALPLQEAHQIITAVELKLKDYYGAATHVIIHLEPYKDIKSLNKIFYLCRIIQERCIKSS